MSVSMKLVGISELRPFSYLFSFLCKGMSGVDSLKSKRLCRVANKLPTAASEDSLDRLLAQKRRFRQRFHPTIKTTSAATSILCMNMERSSKIHAVYGTWTSSCARSPVNLLVGMVS